MLEQLDRAGARIVGIAINRVSKTDTDYMYRGMKKYHVYSMEEVEQGDDEKESVPKVKQK
jgi:hypothetical protein